MIPYKTVIFFVIFLLQRCLCFDLFRVAEHLKNNPKNHTLDYQSYKCLEYLKDLVNLTEPAPWKLQMLDASAKMPWGILSGNLYEMGDYDQCLRIKNVFPDSTTMHGQHCMVNLKATLKGDSAGNSLTPTPELTLGYCIPNICSPEEFQTQITEAAKNLLNKLGLDDVELVFRATVNECHTAEKDNKAFDAGDWIVLSVFSIILICVIASTIYDTIIHIQRRKPAHIILIAFSILSNGKKLIAVSDNPALLPCLNGIRFISMAWIILCHGYFSLLASAVVNSADVTEWAHKWTSYYAIGGSVSVDTFLVLSGFLVMYSFMKAHKRGEKFNLPLFYLHRYLRLTPALAAMVFFQMTLIRHCASGPKWPFMQTILVDPCRKYWWSSLLYVQNYVNENEETCLGHSWYLSVDMQLFILCPIILVPIVKWPKATYAFMALLLAGSIAGPFAVTWIYDLDSEHYIRSMNPDYMTKYYNMTHTRYGTYLMGMILGYVVFRQKEAKFDIGKIPKIRIYNSIGWLVALTTMLAALFGAHNIMNHEWIRYESALYNAFHRHAWALGVSFVIYSCINGYGGPVNWFLSLPMFQILARFTYGTYLVHQSLQFFMVAGDRATRYFSNINDMYRFWGDMWFSLGLGTLLIFGFESPMLVIEKVLFSRSGQHAKAVQGGTPPAKEQ